ncbi:gamma-glutamylcyclotransferase family protein [Pseudothermotoga sp.]|uniref:gamma-glutamylcyclotransferase family protein n=1 Tax=Pseudothermotoga sp. TaxID=2033661 RepID=UPI0031F6EAA1
MESKASCWYFAYGSNMYTDQIQRRVCRQHIEWKVGYLRDHKLVFNKPASDGTGYANIMLQKGSTVYGVLYKLTEKEMEVLDRFEGSGYQRRELKITVEENRQVTAYVYIALQTMDGLLPRADYLERIIKGAKEHHLPQYYIQELEQLPRTS